MITAELSPDRSGWSYRLVSTNAFGICDISRLQIQCDRKPLSLGLISVLLGEGTIGAPVQVSEHEIHLHLPYGAVAKLPARSLLDLGLPPVVPFRFRGRGVGTFGDHNPRVEWWFEDDQGLPVPVERRAGGLLEMDGRRYTIIDPLFTFLEAVEHFNARPGDTLAERTERWAVVAANAPAELPVEGFLGRVRIIPASSCTVRPGKHGGRDVVMPIPGTLQVSVDGSEHFRPCLSEDQQHAFERAFFLRPKVPQLYGLGDASYLLLNGDLQRALQEIRKAADLPIEAQREMIQRPQLAIADAMSADAANAVDAVIWDGDYSTRVEGLGPRPKRVVPWVQQPPQKWLPPAELGLLVDESRLALDPSRLPQLREALIEAANLGNAEIEFAGVKVPVTSETIASVEALIVASGRPRSDAPAPAPLRTVLVVTPNYDVVGFAAEGREQREGETADPQALLKLSLMKHQQLGLGWLYQHWKSGSRGCLLADDMGLGKTLQCLAFLAMIKKSQKSAKVLIVAPTGLLRNWELEHDKCLLHPGLGRPLLAYSDTLRSIRIGRGHELAAGAPKLDLDAISNAHWVLATYEGVRDYQHSFGQIDFDVVVFDEAQRIKNPDAGISQAAKALKASFALALSGTPVENRYADLWSILDTVCPGLLGSLKDFSRTYEADLERNGPRLRERLVTGQPPRMLRRLKDQILELPPKRQHVHRTGMPAAQAGIYERIIAKNRETTDRRSILNVIQALRNVSLHPLLGTDVRLGESDDDIVGESGRLLPTMQILDECAASGRKALVFLDSLDLQGLLVSLLQRRYHLKRPPFVINGDVAGVERSRRVDCFQEEAGFDVMLLSPKAGGVGLTLTAATCVIHLARWWNPAIEDQATDRAYRIGQRSSVDVHYPMAVHPRFGDFSFDIRLDELVTRKRRLSAEILAAPSMSPDEIEAFFGSIVRGQ